MHKRCQPVQRGRLEVGVAGTKVAPKERLQNRPHQRVNDRICTCFARPCVRRLVIHRTLAYPSQGRPLQLRVLGTGIDPTRTLRGAVCGAIAAAVWALQQPLDKVVFASPCDDVELLGKAVTRGEGWYPVGFALHMQNGALFGAVYANLAPTLPLAPALRGPAAALAEHLVSWPLVGLADNFHPARRHLPAMAGNRRAFAQATWRHALFGFVLGELERRINADPEPPEPQPEADYSSNGHGTLEHAVSFEPAS